MLTFEVAGEKEENNLMVNNYGIFLISILNMELNLAVATKHSVFWLLALATQTIV